MLKAKWLVVLGLGCLLALAPAAWAQTRPYIGFVYPAGGQQGTTFQIRLGGQNMDDVYAVTISGTGVSGKIVEYNRRLNNQEQALISEELRDLKRAKKGGSGSKDSQPMMQMDMMQMAAGATTPAGKTPGISPLDALIERLEKRVNMFVQVPACASISTLLEVEITVAPDAPPGEREIRVVTLRGGASNPLGFYVGQVPEYTRKPMRTAQIQVLGKEYLALRKRPAEEAEDHINIPATLNGQIASGEMNQYRFSAREGQRLVITSLARQLVPYIADAVPGWFQPVMVLFDANGKEVAYDDDYRFKPDPVIWYQVPKSGEYVLAIYDSIYRGREDFVYRLTIGELPFMTSIFPLGGPAGVPAAIKMRGWNLANAELLPPPANTPAGITSVAARRGNFISNRLPFALDTLPECFDLEPNNKISRAQKVTLPIIINGRIDKPDDWDVFQFDGKSNDTVVAEVMARRLDSPLDSVLKLTDENGKLIAYNDDREDLGSGLNTHHADSYFMAKLPADGKYFVHLGDTARKGGDEYAYRLRISAPRPDFALRVAPSSTSIRSKGFATLSIYAFRKDGFTNTVKLVLKDPPAGFTGQPVLLTGTQPIARLTFKADVAETKVPVTLTVEGRAKVGDQELVHNAIPAEDRMQAFLWRHLLPAKEFRMQVFDPAYDLPAKHVVPFRPPPPVVTNTAVAVVSNLVLRYSFDEAPDKGAITDKSSQHNDARLTGAQWNATAGKQGGALTFGAANDCLTIANSGTLNPKKITLAVWFKTSKSDAVARRILDKRATRGYALGILGDTKTPGTRGKLAFAINGSYVCQSDSSVTDGVWHQGTAVFDGKNLTLYVDGVPQKNPVACTEDISANLDDLTIGLNRANPEDQEKNHSFDGALDELMVFNRALTPDEVRNLMNIADPLGGKPKFTRQQVASRIRELKRLYEEGLLVDDFYNKHMDECEASIDNTPPPSAPASTKPAITAPKGTPTKGSGKGKGKTGAKATAKTAAQ